MTAACVAALEGMKVLLLEHSSQVGGTTAVSGGMVWVPVNHRMALAGMPDTVEAARAYLGHTVPDARNGSLLQAFLDAGPEVIQYLEDRTSLRFQPVATYPDYYPDAPGATTGGRVLEPVPFDARVLGPEFRRLRPPLPEFTLFGGMMISRSEVPHFRRFWRSPRSAWRIGLLLAQHLHQRMSAPRGTTLHLGNALAARLFKSVLDLGVTLRFDSPVSRLLWRDGAVRGVEVRRDGRLSRLIAHKGVILACGGISRDPNLRSTRVPESVGALSATADTGSRHSGAALAIEVGGRLTTFPQAQAYWVPGSRFMRPDGSQAVFPHVVTDRGKPGVIAVDQNGQRFTNEAVSYHEFVLKQLAAGPAAIPAFLICDRRFLWKYGLGKVKPFALGVTRQVRAGYLKRGRTIVELAQVLGVPGSQLEAAVEEFNRDASRGQDRRFGRGGDAYQRHMGDAEHKPNPCVAPLAHAPYYAVEIRPADLGMAAGLVTDASARVLDAEGAAIPGLYACGNDMQSVMNGAYPGPGITLGPALVFGCIAARSAARP